MAWLNSREFYDLMQAYRHADTAHITPAAAVEAYEAVKAAIRQHTSPQRRVWQDISTCPQNRGFYCLPDDRPFAVLNSNHFAGAATSVSKSGDAIYETAEETISVCSGVTHWAELPAPPDGGGDREMSEHFNELTPAEGGPYYAEHGSASDYIVSLTVGKAGMTEGGQHRLMEAAQQVVRELQQARAALQEVREAYHWLLHHGGLLNEWAGEWIPQKHGPLIPWLQTRIDAALTASSGQSAK